ncbi:MULTISPECIES: deoxyribodipyrimidine photo-lyase [Marinobacter]|uniref:Deoxyribodipyrimidine photo-lyase n=1 Tax=Marinobacter xiaoshiensis TaxID=3073652 RepID=A0ABU2HCE2_9GAMM|nr:MULTISPECIES: deoxyribodipyrimidine photo-lyase [unclassified Marinobacter]MDS1308753.1 deoxyribodipyrimidine photo-lyase [Marinobacter sp. F60267]
MHDNAALLAASKSDTLLCVYVVDPRWFMPGPLQSKTMGAHRWRFLWQSLMELERSLRALGQWQAIQDKLPGRVFQEFETLSLFTQGSLPMSLEDLPDTFSQFRKQIEKIGERGPDQLRISTLTALTCSDEARATDRL